MITTGYDAELRRHNAVLRRASGVRLHDRVLDVGCGSGQTTREAARAAREGSALGVDVSARAVSQARELARDDPNVAFEQADAQIHPFPPGSFDLAISRFGTMFFDDAVAAFANVGRALRTDGRLVMLVWQAADRNEWDVVIRRELTGSPEPAAGPDAFSLADPPVVTGILGAAGFADVELADVHEAVCYGPEVAAALDWILSFTRTSELLGRLAPAAAAGAIDRLRAALEAHLTSDGVWLDSRAWLVTARRR